MTTAPAIHTATASQTIGPFFHFALGGNTSLGCLVRADTKGERIRLKIRVLDGEGAPVSDALVELLQADAEGAYNCQDFSGFGRLATGDDGACLFETIRPGRVPDHHGGWQGSHMNLCLFARGILRHLYTRVYFADDPALEEDAILALVPATRRATLLARPVHDAPEQWFFDIRLRGERETVFFDL